MTGNTSNGSKSKSSCYAGKKYTKHILFKAIIILGKILKIPKSLFSKRMKLINNLRVLKYITVTKNILTSVTL